MDSMVPTHLVCRVREHCTVARRRRRRRALVATRIWRAACRQRRCGWCWRGALRAGSRGGRRGADGLQGLALAARRRLRPRGTIGAAHYRLLRPARPGAPHGSAGPAAARCRGADDGARRAPRGPAREGNARGLHGLSRRRHPGEGRPRKHARVARSARAAARPPDDRIRVRLRAFAPQGDGLEAQDPAQAARPAPAAARIRPEAQAGVLHSARHLARGGTVAPLLRGRAARCRAREPVRPALGRMLLDGRPAGLRNGRLFGLALFELWRREYRVSL